ncbi:flagellar assembly protein FliH [Haloimpatiens lingqiaonensis]|uniref:FliH/SctL family protein n=1 Tax=Haloimpatiens lingqiaonensis TaxID=1380675 RepID=UPI0010FDEC08|nr:flagellar assembly protein FliH [Haloimpatiens lingqiaonensis]
MQSSFNVIKNENAEPLGEKEIVVEYVPRKVLNTNLYKESDENLDKNLENEPYSKLATSIVEAARSKSDEIIRKAYEEAAKVQMEAEKKGHRLGHEKGYKEGYEEGYRKALEEAQNEALAIIETANAILKSAKVQYEEYLEEKEENIKELMVEIVSNILKKEVKCEDTISNLIREVVKDSRKSQVFIIKCNSVHEDKLKEEVEHWKVSLGIKGEIFIIADDFLEEAQVIVEKDNGKVEIHIEESIEKIKDIILNS